MQNRLHRAIGQSNEKKLKRNTAAKVPIAHCDTIKRPKNKGNPKKNKNDHTVRNQCGAYYRQWM